MDDANLLPGGDAEAELLATWPHWPVILRRRREIWTRCSLLGLNGAVSLQGRVAAFRDRAPRRTALFIVTVLLGVLTIDGIRLHSAHARLAGAHWSHGIALGLISGAVLLAVTGLAWLVARRYEALRPPIELVGAVTVVLLMVVTHSRHGDDAVRDQGMLALLVAADLLFTCLLIYAAGYRWTRVPTTSASQGEVATGWR